MKVGDLVKDIYRTQAGVGLVLKEYEHHIQWDGASVCKVFWSNTGHIGLRRTAYLEEMNESR